MAQTLREFGESHHIQTVASWPWPLRQICSGSGVASRLALKLREHRLQALARSALRLEILSLIEPLGMLYDDRTPDRALRALSSIPLKLELSEQARIACRFALGAGELPSAQAAESEEWLTPDEKAAWAHIASDLRDGFPLSAPSGALQTLMDTLNSLRALELADWPSKVWGAAIERESIELALEWPAPSEPTRRRNLAL